MSHDRDPSDEKGANAELSCDQVYADAASVPAKLATTSARGAAPDGRGSCSSLDTLRNKLTITVPLSVRHRSQSLMFRGQNPSESSAVVRGLTSPGAPGSGARSHSGTG